MQLCVNTPSALSTTDNPEPRGRQHSEVEQRRKSLGRGRVTGSSKSWCFKEGAGGGAGRECSREPAQNREVSPGTWPVDVMSDLDKKVERR